MSDITILITDITPQGSLSVLTQDEEGNNHREALVPGQYERMYELLHEHKDLYYQVKDLWTPELVQAYEDMIAAQREKFAPADNEPYIPPPTQYEQELLNQVSVLQKQLAGISDQIISNTADIATLSQLVTQKSSR